jgi:hypothetical protein
MDTVSLKPRYSRIVLYFLGIFAAVAAPTAVPWLFIFLGPPAYSLKAGAPVEVWRGPTTTGGGARVTTRVFPSVQAAAKGMSGAKDAINTDLASTGPGTFRYRRADSGVRGALVRADNVVVQVEAGDADAVERALAELPFLAPSPGSADRWLHGLFEHHLVALLVGLGAYLLVVAVAMFKGGAWAARIPPVPGVSPVSLEEMRRRLLAVNGLDVPFQVREGKRGYLIAEWRLADARWTGLFEQAGLSISHWVKMKLDGESHVVRVIDFSRTVRWSASVARAAFSFSFFRGITFGDLGTGESYGVLFKDGSWTVNRAYQYSYNLSELKQPLAVAIVSGGWTCQPVAFFLPLLG